MDKIKTTKIVARLIVGVSTSFTVANTIRANSPAKNRFQEAQIWIGSVAMGAVAAKATEKHVDGFVDEIVDNIESMKN